jgi:hypothetical protein
MAEPELIVHVLIISNRAGETALFLIEREPGIVEFPTLVLPAGMADDEEEIVRRVKLSTGLTVAINAFLDSPASQRTALPGSRFVLARILEGTPQIAGPSVGWEWRPGTNLLAREHIPKSVADELRTLMNS